MSEFITVENISKTYKINKRGKGIPGMVANLFVPKYELKEAVKYKVERFTGMIVETVNVNVIGVKL